MFTEFTNDAIIIFRFAKTCLMLHRTKFKANLKTKVNQKSATANGSATARLSVHQTQDLGRQENCIVTEL